MLWILVLLAVSAVRAWTWAQPYLRAQPDEDVYVVLPLVGGRWTLLGPPAAFVVAWWIARRLR